MILCSKEEILKVAEGIKDLRPLVATIEDHVQLSELKQIWDSLSNGLLVCSDDHLVSLNIHNSTCLVNYSIPRVKRDAYTFRFSLIVDNSPNHYRPNQVILLINLCCVFVFFRTQLKLNRLPFLMKPLDHNCRFW